MDFDENKKNSPVITTYHEKKIGKTTYRVTNIYTGQFELGKAIEDLIIKKILREGTDYGKTKIL